MVTTTRSAAQPARFSVATVLALLALVGREADARAQAVTPADPSSATQYPEPADTGTLPEDASRLPFVETEPMQPGLGMRHVHLDAGAHPFFVYFGKGKLPIAACRSACDFWAWPGKYRVRVRQGEGPNDDATLALRVRRSGRYTFVHANGATQNAGLILGASGPALGFVGLVFTAAGLLQSCSDETTGHDCGTPPAVYVGLGALAASAVMTTTGWLLYAHNRAHFQFGDAPSATRGARWSLGRGPRGGLTLNASLAF